MLSIITINPDGSGKTTLVSGVLSQGFYAMSPDESKILYSAETYRDSHIYMMKIKDINTGTVTDLDPDVFSYHLFPQQTQSWQSQIFSPDGSKIVYHSDENGNWDIYTINVDGTGKTQLTTDTSDDRSAYFSPDGSKILFVSDRTGNNDIWLMTADGSNKEQLTTNISDDIAPSWSPDGNKIVFPSDRAGNYDIWMMELGTASDSIPPASITNLQNVSYAQNYIHWAWTDPTDPDFANVMIYVNGSFLTSITKGVQYYNATGLKPNTSYEIGTRTVDNSGNVNQGWVNDTATTLPASLTVTAMCPVNLNVKDPEGFVINIDSSEIPGAVYTETDLNGDGDPDDRIFIPNRKVGDYQITVIKEDNAEPSDTYTLEVSAPGTNFVLAENVPISDIPDQPYILEVTDAGIKQLPFTSFSYSPEYPVVNQTITFNASSSYDPDGGPITNYEWVFGDGNVTNTAEPIITHSFVSAGDYTVNLTVTDDDGATNKTSKIITVTRLCGDVNCNAEVDIGDVILLLNNVSHPGNSTYVLCNDWSGDCRCTGVRDIGDVILLLNNVSYPENQRYVLACC